MAAPLIGGLIGGVIGGVLPALLGKLFGQKKQRCCQHGQQFNNFPMQQPGCPGGGYPPNPMMQQMAHMRAQIAQMQQMLGMGGAMPGQLPGAQNPFQAGYQQGLQAGGGAPNPYQAGYQAGLQAAGGGGPNPYQSGFQAGMASEMGGGPPGYGSCPGFQQGFPSNCSCRPGGFGGYGGQQGFLGQGGFGPSMAIGAVLGTLLTSVLGGGDQQNQNFNPAFQPLAPMLASSCGAGIQMSMFARGF